MLRGLACHFLFVASLRCSAAVWQPPSPPPTMRKAWAARTSSTVQQNAVAASRLPSARQNRMIDGLIADFAMDVSLSAVDVAIAACFTAQHVRLSTCLRRARSGSSEHSQAPSSSSPFH